MTAVVSPRVALALLLVALAVLAVCAPHPQARDRTPAAAPSLLHASWFCGPVEGGGTYCATHDVPGPKARMLAAALLEFKVRRSLVGAP